MGLWTSIVSYLAPTCSVLVFDNRGVGKSTNGSFERYTTKGLARDAIAVIDAVGWTEDKINLVGISMGGMISMELTCMIPDRINTLTLLCTCAKFKSPKKTFASFGAQLYEMAFPPQTEEEIIKSVSTKLFPSEWMAANDDRYPAFDTNFDRFRAKMIVYRSNSACNGAHQACWIQYDIRPGARLFNAQFINRKSRIYRNTSKESHDCRWYS
jgi:pimeloyl-ACP methyl ester carboxylesterase